MYVDGEGPEAEVNRRGPLFRLEDRLREDEDELVRRITESFLTYRKSVADYMTYADNGQMNARAMDYKY